MKPITTTVDLGDLQAPETAFSTYDPLALAPLPLLMQTGYLTIRSAATSGRRTQYTLGFPNFEIEESFSMWLAEGFCRTPQPELNSALNRMLASLEHNRVPDMLETLKIFFARVPNTITIENEKYYQTIFFTVFTLIGAMVEAEVSTNIGRIDAVVKTAGGIFIFEFKLDGSAEEALEQIRAKRYFEPYLEDGRPVTLIGVEFSRTLRNLGARRIEPLAPGGAARARESAGPAYAAGGPPDVFEIARRLRAQGVPAELIAQATGLPVAASDPSVYLTRTLTPQSKPERDSRVRVRVKVRTHPHPHTPTPRHSDTRTPADLR
ncbi:MAG: PD-(D/E)XK nuclease domain-containing protein [Candidatus Marinimicrobia bacterium]|nr:PD-(D/E)XK nuclease domain-containing protein [Candidatus Neomarinimicrobiota bacterium]